MFSLIHPFVYLTCHARCRGLQQVHAHAPWPVLVRYRLCLALSLVLTIASSARWEFLTSFSFDWQYMSGKRKFKWPLVRSCRVALALIRTNAHFADLLLLGSILPSARSHRNVRVFRLDGLMSLEN